MSKPNVKCFNCNIYFYRAPGRIKSNSILCCSIVCKKQYNEKTNNKKINCVICNKSIYRRPASLNGHNVCSYYCRNKYYSGVRSFVWTGGKRNLKRDREREKFNKAIKKIKAVKLLGGKCLNCGYNKCYASLDFHHLNPETKTKSIKDIISLSWKKIQEELKKCILLCSNCHRERHWLEHNNKEIYDIAEKEVNKDGSKS